MSTSMSVLILAQHDWSALLLAVDQRESSHIDIMPTLRTSNYYTTAPTIGASYPL